MKRTFAFAPAEYYHVYNRGVDRRTIFLDESDHRRFQLLLYTGNSTTPVHLSNYDDWKALDLSEIERGERLVDIGAYCLMPNHFHLLLREREEGGITQFMKKLTTGYSMYFNKKKHRTGALFEGRFKAEHTFDDVYLKYLYAYIHLNPVALIEPRWKKEGIKDLARAKAHLENYRFSSYPDLLGRSRAESAILNAEEFPDYFGDANIGTLADEVEDWLTLSRDKDEVESDAESREV